MNLIESKVSRTITIEVTEEELEYISRLSNSVNAQNFVSSCSTSVQLLRKSINTRLAEIWQEIQQRQGG